MLLQFDVKKVTSTSEGALTGVSAHDGNIQNDWFVQAESLAAPTGCH